MSRVVRFGIVLLMCLPLLVTAGSNRPMFKARDIQGKLHQLADYRGKWVVVNYWASWCPPCLAEIPELVDFHEKHRKHDAVVLGMNFEDTEIAELRKFVDEYMINYPVFMSDIDSEGPFGKIRGLPVSFIISPEGELVTRRVGAVTANELEQIIKSNKVKSNKGNKV